MFRFIVILLPLLMLMLLASNERIALRMSAAG